MLSSITSDRYLSSIIVILLTFFCIKPLWSAELSRDIQGQQSIQIRLFAFEQIFPCTLTKFYTLIYNIFFQYSLICVLFLLKVVFLFKVSWLNIALSYCGRFRESTVGIFCIYLFWFFVFGLQACIHEREPGLSPFYLIILIFFFFCKSFKNRSWKSCLYEC